MIRDNILGGALFWCTSLTEKKGVLYAMRVPISALALIFMKNSPTELIVSLVRTRKALFRGRGVSIVSKQFQALL